MIDEFKKFIMRGNVMDMAVGIVIGAAFGTIIKSLVADIFAPFIGLLMGGVDFANLFSVLKEGATPGPYATLVAAQEAGAVTVNWGVFCNTIISFVIIAIAIFFLIRTVNKMQEEPEEIAESEPEPTEQEKLLTDIRDILKSK